MGGQSRNLQGNVFCFFSLLFSLSLVARQVEAENPPVPLSGALNSQGFPHIGNTLSTVKQLYIRPSLWLVRPSRHYCQVSVQNSGFSRL